MFNRFPNTMEQASFLRSSTLDKFRSVLVLVLKLVIEPYAKAVSVAASICIPVDGAEINN